MNAILFFSSGCCGSAVFEADNQLVALNMDESKTYDLQIFIGRVPGEKPAHYKGIPSLIVAEGPSSATRHSDPSSADTTEEAHSPLYITIANSEVVEVVPFPFGPATIVGMIQSLTENRARLQECVAFGAQLFDFIFHRSVRDLFRRLEDKRTKLRLTLATAIPELAYLPWELLCDTCPGELPEFLSYRRDVHLVRSLRLFNRADFTSADLGKAGQLRILLVTANPFPRAEIDVVKEERMIRFILDEAPPLEGVSLEVLHNATLQGLRQSLLDYKPHVVHMACHGGYNQQEDLGFVALASPEDSSKPDIVNSYRFATLIQEPETVQLAFVNTCYGAFQGTSSAFSGIAQCLHAIGIQDVVALQFFLQDTTAHAIVLNFYKYLLRDRNSVEDSVTKVRRHLFLNGYIFPESFGLTMYQVNTTLAWRKGVPAKSAPASDALSFEQLPDLFEQKMKKEILDRISPELDRMFAIMKDLPAFSNEELLKAMILFENDHILALKVLREAHSVSVPQDFFLKLLDLAKKVAHERYEGKPISTAFLLKRERDAQAYQAQYNVQVGEPLELELFSAPIKELLDWAIKVNGQDSAFLLTIHDDQRKLTTAIQTLKPPSSEIPAYDLNVVHHRWKWVAHNTRDAGCALVLPGDASARLKIFMSGWQVAEYSAGRWSRANVKDIFDGVADIARKVSLPEPLLRDVIQKCLAASERRCGFSLFIQRNDEILPKCHHEGLKHVAEQPDVLGLRDRKIDDFPADEYLNMVAGDGSVIVSSEGRTLAYHAFPAFEESTKVDSILGTGSRHLSAQKITKEIDALGIVVSQDGPISIFFEGIPIARYLL